MLFLCLCEITGWLSPLSFISPARSPTPEAEDVREHGFCLRLIHLSDLKAGWEHSDPLA